RAVVAGLSNERLEARYRKWTLRQIVHHLADSHMHSLIRFKWALTENLPTIKAYDEAAWVQLHDSHRGDVEPALAMLEGLHARWVQLLHALDESDFARQFFHPESARNVSLWEALSYYAWHGAHHTPQIAWVREQHGW
ncbi:MAG: putative metal-dependent hydrolase, partial [Planctomycetales bacterium]|nr:putative metal-dependent hydrolase [Planctomycetales bacterium]